MVKNNDRERERDEGDFLRIIKTHREVIDYTDTCKKESES